MAYQSFEDLDVWKRSCKQAVEICKAVEKWTNFGLKDQMQRSAISVPSNIAEGQERNTDPDFLRFLGYAQGSNSELRTQIYIAARLNLFPQEFIDPTITESKEISAMLYGLIKSVKARK